MPQENKDWKEAWKIQWSRGNVTNSEMPEDFKAFIQFLLDKQREEIIKLIEGLDGNKVCEWEDEFRSFEKAKELFLTEIKKG